MIFGATLHPQSYIFRNWRKQALLTGYLCETPFRWTGIEYVADTVSDKNVFALHTHPHVTTFVVADAPLVVAPADEPVAPVEEELPTEELATTPKRRGRPPAQQV